ncbi:MAG: DNA-binding response regulator [Gammaproteobacteria bacterium]|nr:DNA-binding response regulator [Gammaproteobacteria bacterium]
MDEMTDSIAILSERPRLLSETLGSRYQLQQFPIEAQLLSHLSDDTKLIVLDFIQSGPEALALIERVRNEFGFDQVPIIILHGEALEQTCVQAFEMGCDDIIDMQATEEEIALRCEKLIFNKIANDQLQAQVKQATELAFIAMSDTSDLGINIQFLLEVHQCNNLDELGMRLLQAVNAYGLKASVQLRSEMGVKNMEASGMSRELESKLMWELQHDGRYIDFGKRSVMNYEQVSVLVKDMPLDDEKKYGALKDNLFSLLQGADARLKALENVQQVQDQQQMVRSLSIKMQTMMEEIDAGYQDVMKSIADVVENMSDGINEIIVNLALHEEQERALEKVMEYGLQTTNAIFSKGLQLDENFQHVIKELGVFLSNDKVKFSAEQRKKLLQIINES